jgi:hypothetical protein
MNEMDGYILRAEGCIMIRSHSLKVGGLEGLGIGVKILKWHVNNFRGPLYPEGGTRWLSG